MRPVPDLQRAVDCGQFSCPQVFGIINLTPDSFSDGGAYPDTESAVRAACAMLDSGAFGIDAGAESTRPGSDVVPEEEEMRRLLPFIRELRVRRPEAVISADTRKSSAAKAAVQAGADMINDVSGLRYDPAMADVMAEAGAGVILMHSRGTPQTMKDPVYLIYDDLIADVADSLLKTVEKAVKAGIRREKILLDPGLGFAKTPNQDFELCRKAALLREKLKLPLFYGPSRKSFLKGICGELPPAERDFATAGILAALSLSHVEFVRVHNVTMAVTALKAFMQARGEKI